MPPKNKKREERQIRAAYRRHKKNRQHNPNMQRLENPCGNFEDDFFSLKQQLEVMGLTLREIQGDGNCLFRAFSDQLFGHSEKHWSIRKEVVEFMRKNRDDFEPFLVDERSFERHLELLEEDGTFGGNDSIVAFARLYDVTVVIHQLNRPLWQVKNECGSISEKASLKEIHISYHNGEHYNSIRRIGEEPHARKPADVRISAVQNKPEKSSKPNEQTSSGHCHGNRNSKSQDCDTDLSDYENLTKEEALVAKVMKLAGTDDSELAQEILEENDLCVEAAIDQLLQMQTFSNRSQGSQNQSTGIWSENGTGNRIFGEEIAKSANRLDNSQRLNHIQDKLKSSKKLSNKERQKLKKVERKLNSENRKKEKKEQEEDGEKSVIVSNLKTLSI